MNEYERLKQRHDALDRLLEDNYSEELYEELCAIADKLDHFEDALDLYCDE